jgi:hypothetical protein
VVHVLAEAAVFNDWAHDQVRLGAIEVVNGNRYGPADRRLRCGLRLCKYGVVGRGEGDPLDVRQLPRLVEQRLFGTVKAEEHFELSARVRRHPVQVLGPK